MISTGETRVAVEVEGTEYEYRINHETGEIGVYHDHNGKWHPPESLVPFPPDDE